MKLEKLQEPFDCDKDFFAIDEDKADSKYLVQMKFKFGKADELNGNNRIYPSEVLQIAFEQFNKKAELRKVLSSADHPMGMNVELKNVSHVIEKVYMDAEKNLWAEGGLLKTGSGRDIWAILKSGGKIGSSMRGFGNLSVDNKVESYSMSGVDFVSVGSFGKDAEVTSADILSESLSVELKSEEKEELRKNLRFNEALKSGFVGSQEEYEKIMKEAKIPEEETIKEIQYKTIQRHKFNEAIESGFKGTFEDWKKIQNKE